jgi:hypothetical protein
MPIAPGTTLGPYQISGWLKPAAQLPATMDRPYATLGDRFLVGDLEPDPRASTIHLLLNWTAPGRR